jgi:hypothetical protein
MVTIHATHEQTNMILRNKKTKNHMKNKHKNIVNGSPEITLYPSPQWKKNTEDIQEKYHNSMKNNKGFDKKNKNKIYNEKTFFQIMKSLFPDKYKNNVNPVKYNEYMDKYIEDSDKLNAEECENLKSAYLKYYNRCEIQSKLKYAEIIKKHKEKKSMREKIQMDRQARINTINSMNEKLDDTFKIKGNRNKKILTTDKFYKVFNRTQEILKNNNYSTIDQYVNDKNAKPLQF